MGFVLVDIAIGAAMLGLEPDGQLPPSLDLGGPSRGARVPAYDGQAEGNVKAPKLIGSRTIRSSQAIPTAIPVYRFSPRGVRSVEVWPSFSYELIGAQFNPQRYIWKADQFRVPVRTSEVETAVGVGPSLRRHRDHPEPFDLMYEVRVWSKNTPESIDLQHSVFELFPARGALKALQLDGTTKLWEMYLTSINNVDDEEPTLEGSMANRQGAFSWVNTYIVETFLDNTLVTELRRTVTSPPNLDMP